jgi:hypothetical protein
MAKRRWGGHFGKGRWGGAGWVRIGTMVASSVGRGSGVGEEGAEIGVGRVGHDQGRWGPEVGDDSGRWAPPVGECVREGRERWAGGGRSGPQVQLGRAVENGRPGRRKRGEGGPRLKRREREE